MVEAIRGSVKAERYRPVYGMHRYFARRPHSVFAHLVDHYTAPGDVVLDPFFGGGVTLVEGALLGRRVVGFDLNPMAAFITRMELAPFDAAVVRAAHEEVVAAAEPLVHELFVTRCPECRGAAVANWFELSAATACQVCGARVRLSGLEKVGLGAWGCSSCASPLRFSVTADTREELDLVHLRCRCGYSGTKPPDDADIQRHEQARSDLAAAEARGLFIPNHAIPDCNMQRESALHKKGINLFRQLFTPRVLLAWGLVRDVLRKLPQDETSAWLWFTFSSALRYANRMVTRNPGWRGEKPLEWAKPGYWLPPVHLEVNVLDQFERRFASICRAKARMPPLERRRAGTPDEVLTGAADYSVNVASSTSLPLPNGSVDAVITDPPYGSYVHYGDLTNFWSVWLPDWLGVGLGKLMDTTEEAVVARKKGFPGAKSAVDYADILGACFTECRRVLKPSGVLVLTFNNREPRAWVALLAAAARAGFELDPGGVVYQPGIKVYEHTAQSRRAGSIIGDFIYTFRVGEPRAGRSKKECLPSIEELERWFVESCRRLLIAEGPLKPRDLFVRLYMDSQVYLSTIVSDLDESGLDDLVAVTDQLGVFDSHRRQLLERHFNFIGGRWMARAAEDAAA